jgi:hypothetical protein
MEKIHAVGRSWVAKRQAITESRFMTVREWQKPPAMLLNKLEDVE